MYLKNSVLKQLFATNNVVLLHLVIEWIDFVQLNCFSLLQIRSSILIKKSWSNSILKVTIQKITRNFIHGFIYNNNDQLLLTGHYRLRYCFCWNLLLSSKMLTHPIIMASVAKLHLKVLVLKSIQQAATQGLLLTTG